MDRLAKLRLLLLGDKTDITSDDLIEVLIEGAQKRLLFMLNQIEAQASVKRSLEMPEELTWMVDEAVIKRFNRLGSEGYQSQTVGSHSVTFLASDLEEFRTDLTAFVAGDKAKFKKGRVVIY